MLLRNPQGESLILTLMINGRGINSFVDEHLSMLVPNAWFTESIKASLNSFHGHVLWRLLCILGI